MWKVQNDMSIFCGFKKICGKVLRKMFKEICRVKSMRNNAQLREADKHKIITYAEIEKTIDL